MTPSAQSTMVIEKAGLDALLAYLSAEGFTVLGPREQDGAIRYVPVHTTRDLPAGLREEQAPGRYRLRRDGAEALFAHSPGPDSWKRFFFPPDRHVWTLRLRDGVFEPVRGDEDEQEEKYAILGARACELRALQVQDRVFAEQHYCDEAYVRRRAAAFVVAVNCSRSADTCFCDAMGAGPRCSGGFDLALTELVADGSHEFLVEIGSEAGFASLEGVCARPATDEDRQRARDITETARRQQHRGVPGDVAALLARNAEHPAWEEVAARCLACGNCTAACPTCFCSDFEDTADLTGTVAERRQKWSSCFNASFSYTHGGSIRGSTAARYRQWLTHKLSTWYDQFDTSGCVGCGRCITWCPVGIDITQEVAAIAARDGEHALDRAAEHPGSP